MYAHSLKKWAFPFFVFSLLLAHPVTYTMHQPEPELDLDILPNCHKDVQSNIFAYVIGDHEGGISASEIYNDLPKNSGHNYAARTMLLYLNNIKKDGKLFSITPAEQLDLMYRQPDAYNLLRRLDPAFKIQSDEQQTGKKYTCFPMNYNTYITKDELKIIRELPNNIYNRIIGYSLRVQNPSSDVIKTYIIRSPMAVVEAISFACLMPFYLGIKLIDEVNAKITSKKPIFDDLTWTKTLSIPYRCPHDHLMNITHGVEQPIEDLMTSTEL